MHRLHIICISCTASVASSHYCRWVNNINYKSLCVSLVTFCHQTRSEKHFRFSELCGIDCLHASWGHFLSAALTPLSHSALWRLASQRGRRLPRLTPGKWRGGGDGKLLTSGFPLSEFRWFDQTFPSQVPACLGKGKQGHCLFVSLSVYSSWLLFPQLSRDFSVILSSHATLWLTMKYFKMNPYMLYRSLLFE